MIGTAGMESFSEAEFARIEEGDAVMRDAKDTMGSWYDWAREHTNPERASRKPEALDDLLVLDVSYGNVGGLACSSMLAELGAQVIRLEPPGGDVARQYSPFGIQHQDTGLGYLAEGRNKYHITLDLKRPESHEIFTTLAKHADVVVETYQPGVMDGWGIGYRQLKEVNPRLIYAALCTYGQFGPSAGRRPGSEITNQAYSGLVYINGEPEHLEPTEYGVPTKVGSWYGWYAEGLFAAYGILLALNFRTDTGKGQLVDVSGAECIMKFIDYNLSWFHMDGKVKSRLGNYDVAVFPYTFIRCKEGYTFLAAYNDEAFQTLMEIIERPEMAQDPRFASFMNRTAVENEEALQFLLEEWSMRYPVDEVIQRVQEAISQKEGRAAAVVTGKVTQPSEVLQEQNWWNRGVFQKIQDHDYGELTLQGPTWKMSGTPPRIKWACRPCGADNEFIYLKYLGLGSSQLADLKARGVI
jgi:crotonobetainyl-CoA:carnitine CoA-transferase CaiB-like acyl-CoA transferase